MGGRGLESRSEGGGPELHGNWVGSGPGRAPGSCQDLSEAASPLLPLGKTTRVIIIYQPFRESLAGLKLNSNLDREEGTQRQGSVARGRPLAPSGGSPGERPGGAGARRGRAKAAWDSRPTEYSPEIGLAPRLPATNIILRCIKT